MGKISYICLGGGKAKGCLGAGAAVASRSQSGDGAVAGGLHMREGNDKVCCVHAENDHLKLLNAVIEHSGRTSRAARQRREARKLVDKIGDEMRSATKKRKSSGAGRTSEKGEQFGARLSAGLRTQSRRMQRTRAGKRHGRAG